LEGILRTDDGQVSGDRYGLPRCVKSSETPAHLRGRRAGTIQGSQLNRSLTSRVTLAVPYRKTTGGGWLQWQRPSAKQMDRGFGPAVLVLHTQHNCVLTRTVQLR